MILNLKLHVSVLHLKMTAGLCNLLWWQGQMLGEQTNKPTNSFACKTKAMTKLLDVFKES